jgi:hypothetical protein
LLRGALSGSAVHWFAFKAGHSKGDALRRDYLVSIWPLIAACNV